MNELNCPICGNTLVNSWELWGYMGEEVSCCNKTYLVEYDEQYIDEINDWWEWFELKEIK